MNAARVFPGKLFSASERERGTSDCPAKSEASAPFCRKTALQHVIEQLTHLARPDAMLKCLVKE